MDYNDKIADAQEAVCDALGWQSDEMLALAEPESDSALRIAEALAALATAQARLTEARALAALEDTEGARAKLKASLDQTAIAAAKLAEAFGD